MRDPIYSYYFGFGSTGVPEIDDVLAAVARAGTAYHSTEFWSDTDSGQSQTSKIQDAANASAEILKAKDAELASLKAENADLTARLERAENLARDMLDPERFGWAVTGEGRDAARAVLGIAPCEALKGATMSEVEIAKTRLLNWIDEVNAGTYEVPAKSPGFVDALIAAVEREALERAARLAEEPKYGPTGCWVSEAIRALIESKEG